jgi:phage baseplate assembly protein W
VANLTLATSTTQSYVTGAKGRVLSVTLNVTLTDVRPFVVYKPLELLVEWGDGATSKSNARVPSPYSAQFQHSYTVGNYVLKVTGKNYQVPLPDIAVESIDVRVSSPVPKVPTLADQGLKPIVFGPILPRDEGYPNAQEWSFQSSQDSVVLESSARMLLITAVGERLMQPEYGTKLPLMIFDQSVPTLQDDVTQEVVRAFSIHEPRLAVTSVSLNQIGEKQIKISVSLLSKLDQRQFVVSTTFVQS